MFVVDIRRVSEAHVVRKQRFVVSGCSSNFVAHLTNIFLQTRKHKVNPRGSKPPR